MKELVKLIYDEMRSGEIWDALNNEHWNVFGDGEGITITRGSKTVLDEGSVEEAAKVLGPIYNDFIQRTEEYLNAVKDGQVWTFINHFGVETEVRFGADDNPECNDWAVISGGDLVYTSENLEDVAEYIRREHLDLGE